MPMRSPQSALARALLRQPRTLRSRHVSMMLIALTVYVLPMPMVASLVPMRTTLMMRPRLFRRQRTCSALCASVTYSTHPRCAAEGAVPFFAQHRRAAPSARTHCATFEAALSANGCTRTSAAVSRQPLMRTRRTLGLRPPKGWRHRCPPGRWWRARTPGGTACVSPLAWRARGQLPLV